MADTIGLTVVNTWVLVAAIPYLAVAGYDFWLHETHRSVPRIEGCFHAVIVTGVGVFLAASAMGYNRVAGSSLACLLLAAAVDELRFHGGLDARERRLHYAGGAALAFCIGVWVWTIW